MKTVIVASQKGGSSKSTICALLGVAAEDAGKGPTVLADADPQQTLARWWNMREAETPKLAAISMRELPAQLAALAEHGFRYAFVDTPPAMDERNRSIFRLADFVIIPVRPSIADLWSVGSTVDFVKQAGVPFAFALTQAKANTKVALQTVAALSEHGQVFEAVIHDRVAFATAMTDGRTAQEIDPASPAALESVALWKCVEARIRNLTKKNESTQYNENARKEVVHV